MVAGNSILKNTTFLVSGQIASRLIRTFLVILIARKYGPTEYGQYSFAFALVISFILFADLGLANFLAREIARHKSRAASFVTNALILKLLYSILTIAAVYSVCVLSGKGTTVLIFVTVLLIAHLIDSFVQILKAALQAFERMQYEAIGIILKNSLITLTAASFIFMNLPLTLVITAFVVGNLIEGIYIAKYYRKLVGRFFTPPEMANLRPLARMALPFGWQQIFATLYTFADRTLISFLKGDEAVGYYDVAYKIIFLGTFVMMAFGKAIFPPLSRLYKENKAIFENLYRSVFKIACAIGFAYAAIFAINAHSTILFMFGENYLEAVPALIILSVASFFLLVNLILGPTIRAMNMEHFTAKVAGATFLLNILVNLVLIPLIGILGAAVATLISEATVSIFYLRVSKKYISKLISPADLLKFGGIALAFVFWGFLFQDLSFFYTILGLPAIFAGLVFGVRFVRSTEISLFRSWIVPSTSS